MWPKLSNIDGTIKDKILSYDNAQEASKLNSWIRIFSGAKKGQFQGLILQSNTSSELLRATGETTSTIYGDSQSSGIIGKDWTGKPISATSTRFLRPSPIVTGFSVKEGQDQISREATLQLQAYTLEQMEEIQTYFLEPGYSLFIEWGWNTQSGARGVTETAGADIQKILNTISTNTLNWQDLVATRLKSVGQYDGFLGFIVGGSVSSEGDTFSIEVRLRGEPSLPTYLQSYRNSKKLNETGTDVLSSDKVNTLFSVKELTDESEAAVAKRRFQYMFNELPSDKQLNSVKRLPETTTITQNMFINFDKHIEKNIINGSSGRFEGNSELNDAGIEIQKESLYSKNKYIRMDLAVQILNTLGKLDTFIVGNKQVSFKININNTIIGGFPNMFSTNANKLIIPGVIPNFTKYFLTGDVIIQDKTGKINNASPDDPDKTLQPFLGTSPLRGEYQEDPLYYGYLKYLFVNFDVFKAALGKKIINSREAFIYILNEMSSAVNAFWKFQIVEGEFKPSYSPFIGPTTESRTPQNFISTDAANQQLTTTGDSSGLKVGDVEITVIDENFVGKLNDDISKNVTIFKHNGIGSVFLNANLDISLPSSMVGQIVSQRLGSAVNPDSQIYSIGEKSFFNSETDLFISLRPVENEQPAPSGSVDTTTTAQKKKEEFDNKYITSERGGGTFIFRAGSNIFSEDPIGVTQKQGDGTLKASPTTTNAELVSAVKDFNDVKEEERKEKEASTSNLQAYLNKIDVVPKSSVGKVNNVSELFKDSNLTSDKFFKDLFAIYCFDDSDFFDLLKQHYLRDKYEDGKSLSTLIPIKYTFTILGNSGIRRGDVFRISGIPKKYSEKGIFQVTEIEHTLEGTKWTTQIGGLFRQLQ